jgi:hypothetical protein
MFPTFFLSKSRAGYTVVGGARGNQNVEALSVKTNLCYGRQFFVLISYTKNTNNLFVILQKQMSEYNLWILFLGRPSQSLRLGLDQTSLTPN